MSEAGAMVVGRVARVARFPVKSMQGEVLSTASVGPAGVRGDRGLGVVDTETGLVLSAKRLPQLLDGEARTADDSVSVRLPGGDWLPAPSPMLDAAVSSWLDRPVQVEAPPSQEPRAFQMSMNVDDEGTDVFDWPCPAGTFFDLAAVHLLTTASLRAATRLHPGGAWELQRFRPTVVVEADGDGFVEDDWVGGRLRFGTVEIEVLMPTIRCVMTTRAQGGLPRDLEIVKTVNHHHDGNLGVYCSVATPGEVAVGDEVRFSPK